jgi:epoxide hydrolase-like predicted phosphatase
MSPSLGIKAAIFDFGGVVITPTTSIEVIAHAYQLNPQIIISHMPPFVEKLSVGSITELEFWSLLSQTLHQPIPPNAMDLWRLEARKFSFYWPIIHLIKKLNHQRICTIVLSNVIPPHAEITRQYGGYQLFDHVFLSCEIGLRKPDPAIYQYVLGHIKLTGPECLYIDDLTENLIPARNLGMKTILAINPLQVVKDIRQKINL